MRDPKLYYQWWYDFKMNMYTYDFFNILIQIIQYNLKLYLQYIDSNHVEMF